MLFRSDTLICLETRTVRQGIRGWTWQVRIQLRHRCSGYTIRLETVWTLHRHGIIVCRHAIGLSQACLEVKTIRTFHRLDKKDRRHASWQICGQGVGRRRKHWDDRHSIDWSHLCLGSDAIDWGCPCCKL